MTTIFGLKHPDINAAILVADRQITYANKETGYREAKFIGGRKLWQEKNGRFCFGHAGTFDSEMQDFVQEIINGEVDLEEIINQKHFPKLREINIRRMGNQIPNLKSISGMVFATRLDAKPKLYTCFPLGEVGEREWTTVGSGEEHVIKYMDALNVMSKIRNYQEYNAPSLTDGIRVGLEAVRLAQSEDIHSHGLDLMICTPEGIKDHYNDLTDQFGETLKKIQEQYKK